MAIQSKRTPVSFQNVTKAYGSVVAVDGVSFKIDPGTLVTLLGPSGCGKTTTLRLIAGLEMATSGRILIGDDDVSNLPATERDVSMVFQSYTLFPHMTVIENVGYGLSVSGMKKADVRERAQEGLKLIGLEGFGGRLPSELSGGQQQRVAVARALVLEPAVMLFDEPLSNLDAKLRRQVREDIRDLQQNLGLTTVYVTHDQEEALAVSDEIIVMKNAVIAQQGSPVDLYEEPADHFVADFIGDANMVKGGIKSIDGEIAVLDIAGVERRLPHRGLPVGEVDIAIRPQSIRIANGAESGIPCTIRKATYLGSHIEYRIDTPQGELFAISHDLDGAVAAGTSVSVTFAPRGVTIVRG